jgi:hypothetical protein
VSQAQDFKYAQFRSYDVTSDQVRGTRLTTYLRCRHDAHLRTACRSKCRGNQHRAGITFEFVSMASSWLQYCNGAPASSLCRRPTIGAIAEARHRFHRGLEPAFACFNNGVERPAIAKFWVFGRFGSPLHAGLNSVALARRHRSAQNRGVNEQARIRSANRFPGFCAAARLGMQTASSRQCDSATMVSTACGFALAVRRMHFPSTNAAGLSPFGWLRDVRSVLVCHGSVWNYAIVSF